MGVKLVILILILITIVFVILLMSAIIFTLGSEGRMRCPSCGTEQESITPCENCGYPNGQTRELPVTKKQADDSTLVYGTGKLVKGMSVALEIEGWPELVIFKFKRVLTMGRGHGIGVDLDLYTTAYESGVSRNHASLHRIAGGVTIRDNGSSNGTWLGLPEEGGEPLEPKKMYKVHDGADLLLGELKITIYFVGGKADARLAKQAP